MTESHSLVPTQRQALQVQDLGGVASREVISIWERIPSDVKELLYVSKNKPRSFGMGITISIRLDFDTGRVFCEEEPSDDPSTIYIGQGLTVPNDLFSVQRPSYYPSYSGLTPQQRYLYLSWLRNVLSPIHVGYVFIFYYGLERQLLLGDFDHAFDMILSLRKVHLNSSFQGYSLNGLVYSCIYRNRPERMKDLLELLTEEEWQNGQLLICAKVNRTLAAEDIAKVLKGLTGINRRYLKNNREDYLQALKEALLERYGVPELNLNEHFPVNKLDRHSTILFANYTFPDQVRNAAIPDYTRDTRFVAFLNEIHAISHDRTKAALHDKGHRKK